MAPDPMLNCLMGRQIVAYWQTSYPPFRRARFVELGNLLLNVGCYPDLRFPF